MKWIGLTGGIGTGKSTVSKLFKDKGVPVIDADLIAHQVVQVGTPGLKAVAQSFGPGVLNSDGSLNRKKLGELVFQDQSLLLKLESILHPLVQDEVKKQRSAAEKNGHGFAIYDVPLLYEKNLIDQFDSVILVYCDTDTQIKRITDRDGLKKEEILKRIKAQIPQDEKKQKADFIIDNSTTKEILQINFDKVYQSLQSGKL